mmetsp:Transcript_72189/g.193029  ORF Transcript_72189/g.193029 Transcript_72189/m.193029 type:complete len:220 (+) Transcript_72189:1027-1686(+)
MGVARQGDGHGHGRQASAQRHVQLPDQVQGHQVPLAGPHLPRQGLPAARHRLERRLPRHPAAAGHRAGAAAAGRDVHRVLPAQPGQALPRRHGDRGHEGPERRQRGRRGGPQVPHKVVQAVPPRRPRVPQQQGLPAARLRLRAQQPVPDPAHGPGDAAGQGQGGAREPGLPCRARQAQEPQPAAPARQPHLRAGPVRGLHRLHVQGVLPQVPAAPCICA